MRQLRISRLAIAGLLWVSAAYAQSVILPKPNYGHLIFPNETDPEILRWGQERVDDFLLLHQMPISENANVQTMARQDLYDALKGFAWAQLQASLLDTAEPTPEEQRLIGKLAPLVKNLSLQHLQIAVNEKNRFLSNRCTWKPDPDLARSASYTYDGAFYCPKSPYALEGSFGAAQPFSPPKAYFEAFGQKKALIEAVSSRPGGLRSMGHITFGGTLILSIGAVVAVSLGAIAASVGTVKRIVFMIFPHVQAAKKLSNVARMPGPWLWVTLGIEIALVLFLIAVTIFFFTENQRVENEYGQLDTQLASATGTPSPTRAQLAQMLQEPRSAQRVYAAFLQMVVPTSAYVTPWSLPAASGADPVFAVRIPGAATATSTPSITFPGWDGERTRIRLWGGWILQEALVRVPNVDPDSINTRFRYLRNGVKYEADRMGSFFAVRKARPDDNDIDCLPDPSTGVTTLADYSNCATFVTRNLDMDLEGSGRRLVSMVQPLAFTSGLSYKVVLGAAASLPVTTTGLPEASISVDGTLPAGFSLTPGSLAGLATLNWSGTGATGNYAINVRASNGVEQKTATINVEVGQTLKWISPQPTDYTYEIGTYVDFTVAATAVPRPTIRLLPFGGSCGLSTVSDFNGNTATVRVFGHILPPETFFNDCKLVFNAETQGQAGLLRDPLTITIRPIEPTGQPFLDTSRIETPMGVFRTHLIRAVGSTKPVTISVKTDSSGNPLIPSWITLQDLGGGNAVLRMQPPADAPNSVTLPLWYRVTGSSGNTDTPPITVNVVRKPMIEWTNGSSFLRFDTTASTEAGFGGRAFEGTGTVNVSIAGQLPDGLRFETSAFGNFAIRGIPQNAFDMTTTINATNAFGTSSIPVRIAGTRPARINSPSRVNFYIGRNNSFEITATGYPVAPLAEASKWVPAPMNIWTDTAGMTSLRANSILFSTADANTGSILYGRALLTGNPQQGGTMTVKVYAQNAGLATDVQDLTLVFTGYGDVNGDFALTCADVTFINNLIGRRRGLPGYDYNADINQDGVIDVRDIMVVTSRFPVGVRCTGF
ncbi:MAG: hypothetical protein JNL98_04170 [Bryobacterales bacterium]|nr:hypothetical protein [Bryobacterales bacterium]